MYSDHSNSWIVCFRPRRMEGIQSKNKFITFLPNDTKHKTKQLINVLSFMQTKYSKNYQNEAEEKFRASIFLNNKRKIVEHNELYEKGLVTFIMGVNKYSDLAHNELSAIKGLKSEHFLG